MDLHHIEAGTLGTHCGLAIILNNRGDLVGLQRPRRAGGMLPRGTIFELDEAHGSLTLQRAGCYRLLTSRLHHLVRDTTHMPQLQGNTATLGVHRLDYLFPACFLLIGPNTRCIDIPPGRRRDIGCLTDDQPSACALTVIDLLQLSGNAIRRARTSQRRHDHTIGQGQTAKLQRGEQCSVRHRTVSWLRAGNI